MSKGRRSARILYVQFTNPAAYPPLEHSSRILAESGYDVVFLGTGAFGSAPLRLPPHARIRVRQMWFIRGGLLQKASYLAYCLWVLAWSVIWRPRVIYGSDPLSCIPIGLVRALTRCSVVYHEHDAPREESKGTSPFLRLVHRSRARLASTAQVVVLPNANRSRQFRESTRTMSEVKVVWNCPRKEEASTRNGSTSKGLRLYYHGSLAEGLLPLSILQAMAAVPQVVLSFAGYETVGASGYLERFRTEAERLGLQDRVRYLGVLSRHELMERCREQDVGLVLLPPPIADNENLKDLVGASNKAFDYLACGLAMMVPNRADWVRIYVDPGYARASDPTDARELAGHLRWFSEHREECRRMGEAGRERILTDWNYEAQFHDVFQAIVRLSE